MNSQIRNGFIKVVKRESLFDNFLYNSYHKCNIKKISEYNIQKRMEVIGMLKLFKKTLAICLIGLGLGILLVLLLPVTGWLFMIGVVVVCVGFMWLAC